MHTSMRLYALLAVFAFSAAGAGFLFFAHRGSGTTQGDSVVDSTVAGVVCDRKSTPDEYTLRVSWIPGKLRQDHGNDAIGVVANSHDLFVGYTHYRWSDTVPRGTTLATQKPAPEYRSDVWMFTDKNYVCTDTALPAALFELPQGKQW